MRNKEAELGGMCFKVQVESSRRAQRTALGISIPPASRTKLESNPDGVAGQSKHVPLVDEKHTDHLVPDVSIGEPNTWGALTFSGNKT